MTTREGATHADPCSMSMLCNHAQQRTQMQLSISQSCCNARSLAWVLIGTQDPSFTKRREQKDRHGTCKTAEQSTHAAHREREERATKRDPAAKCTKGGKRRAAPPQAGLRKALRAVFRSGAPGRWGGCLGQAINDLDPLGLGHLRRANRVGGQESSPLGKADANSTGFVELTWSKPSCRLGQILDQ